MPRVKCNPANPYAVHDHFILTHYRRLTVREIAAQLGIPVGTVITRYCIITGRRDGREYHPTDLGNRRLRLRNGHFASTPME